TKAMFCIAFMPNFPPTLNSPGSWPRKTPVILSAAITNWLHPYSPINSSAAIMLILAFPDSPDQAPAVAAHLNTPVAEAHVHRFPDSESFVELPGALPEHVVFCRSLNQPNDKLIELLLGASKAREMGVRRLSLVAPYLCYMRQDFANRPGV